MQGVISSWLCAYSRDAASFQIPVTAVILLLLLGTKIEFKITAPSWRYLENISQFMVERKRKLVDFKACNPKLQ